MEDINIMLTIKSDIYLSISLFSLLITALIIAPFVHEISIICAVILEGCEFYYLNFKLTLLEGLKASTEILCPLEIYNYVTISLAGFFSTLAIGNLILFFVFYFYRRYGHVLLCSLFIGFGFIFNSLLCFFEKTEVSDFFLYTYGIELNSLYFVGTPLLLSYLYIVFYFFRIYLNKEVFA